MPQVKGQSAKPPNIIQARILAICSALTTWPSPPVNQMRLEKLVGLTAGSLKDAVRRESFSKAVAAALVEKLPGLGVTGVTLDWLHRGDGKGPQKWGILPPRMARDERSHRQAREMPSSADLPDSARSALASHTPAIVAGGEERTPGPLAPDEVQMAMTVFQRALWAAVEHDQQDGTVGGREAIYRTLKDFAGQMFALGLFQVATEIAQTADRLRQGGFTG